MISLTKTEAQVRDMCSESSSRNKAERSVTQISRWVLGLRLPLSWQLTVKAVIPLNFRALTNIQMDVFLEERHRVVKEGTFI